MRLHEKSNGVSKPLFFHLPKQASRKESAGREKALAARKYKRSMQRVPAARFVIAITYPPARAIEQVPILWVYQLILLIN